KFRTVGVLPSVQLKRLRRGLQDAAYLQLLRSQNKKDVANRIINAMVRYAGSDAAGDHYLDPRGNGWISSGQLWIEARRLMGTEIQDADDSKTEHDKIAARVRWGQFINKTHRVRIEKVTTKVTPKTIQAGADGTPGDSAYSVKVFVDLQNEFNRPLDIQLDIATLPPGWTPVKKSARIKKLAPTARQTVELIVEGPALPPLPHAKFPVGFVVSYDGRMQQQTGTFVPALSVGEFSSEPEIDGKLNDWRRWENSVAGNFRLLGERGRIEDSPFVGLAKRQTTVQVMQDEDGENLYFAIICSEPNPGDLIARPVNTVRYDQLLATGEDVVEILLDPGNNAKSPEDLYHIVIKPNGVIIQEKGISTNPPLCKNTPANLGAKFAVAKTNDAWIVEMKIPRSAFGPNADAKFWGVNFTRFSTAGSEASSWGKTERNFYDPDSLGTMIFPNRDRAKENK
ncbi:MAG: hypothetical protein KAR11_08680, partial [Phycisphaerae bacterium]|nr:hypothetical protein [Phycisphaerae bacterium]